MNPSDRDTALKKLAKSNKKLSAKMTTEEKKLIDGEKQMRILIKINRKNHHRGLKITGIRGKIKMTYSQKYCIKLYFEVLY